MSKDDSRGFEGASCACLSVAYRTDEGPPGFHSNCRWECTLCGRRFQPSVEALNSSEHPTREELLRMFDRARMRYRVACEQRDKAREELRGFKNLDADRHSAEAATQKGGIPEDFCAGFAYGVKGKHVAPSQAWRQYRKDQGDEDLSPLGRSTLVEAIARYIEAGDVMGAFGSDTLHHDSGQTNKMGTILKLIASAVRSQFGSEDPRSSGGHFELEAVHEVDLPKLADPRSTEASRDQDGEDNAS